MYVYVSKIYPKEEVPKCDDKVETSMMEVEDENMNGGNVADKLS